MTDGLNNKISAINDIEISLNRLLLQKSALENRMKKQKNNLRKARTRTLIQIGGLVDITPLPAICGIELGQDLQIDYPDKAATLLGILMCAVNRLPENISDDDLMKFKNTGVKFLKQHRKNAKNIVRN